MNEEERELYRSGAPMVYKMNKGNSTQPPKMPRKMTIQEQHQAVSNLDYDETKIAVKSIMCWVLIVVAFVWVPVYWLLSS